MNTDKECLLNMLDDIRKIIIENENPDGSFKLDVTRAMVVLDFAKTEIESTITI